MTRTEARQIARKLVKASWPVVTVVEDMIHGDYAILANNRAWCARRIDTVEEARELLDREAGR